MLAAGYKKTFYIEGLQSIIKLKVSVKLVRYFPETLPSPLTNLLLGVHSYWGLFINYIKPFWPKTDPLLYNAKTISSCHTIKQGLDPLPSLLSYIIYE